MTQRTWNRVNGDPPVPRALTPVRAIGIAQAAVTTNLHAILNVESVACPRTADGKKTSTATHWWGMPGLPIGDLGESIELAQMKTNKPRPTSRETF